MTPATPDVMLFIAGMHRSGTSALCAALRACGANFGEQLLAPMAGVNDDGFWEDAGVVDANDTLLASVGGNWYAPGTAACAGAWPVEAQREFQRRAVEILRRGFGAGPLWAVKDPRFCLTLPLWLQACEALGIATRLCIASRSPLEVAQSLRRRDAFPLGYGLRLDLVYRRALLAGLPADALQVAYPDLVSDPVAVMRGLAGSLPLSVDEAALAASVRRDLRHHQQDTTDSLLATPVIPGDRFPALETAIEEAYPAADMVDELVAGFVARGAELTALGEGHSTALATIATKDASIESLAAEHRQALETIAERDTQIGQLDQHLQETGDHLGHALATITERDEQIAELDRRLAEIGALHSHALEVLDEIHNLPVLGKAVKVARRLRAQR